MTRLFLASWLSRLDLVNEVNPPYVLESFQYLRSINNENLKKFMGYIKSNKCKMFLLDSGAFTYMEKIKTDKNLSASQFEKYVDDYIDFINKWDIEYFFEMDIDVVVGLEKVEEYRKRIEEGTGKKTIPVFHRERGKDYFIKMCKEYDYVAIGGLVGTGYSKKHHKYLQWFVETAHQYNTKIHGLGFTSVEGLKRYNFDTVDSTSWLSGSRFASFVRWNPIEKKLEKIDKPENRRMKKGAYKKIDTVAGREWIKFGNYLEKHNKEKVLKWEEKE